MRMACTGHCPEHVSQPQHASACTTRGAPSPMTMTSMGQNASHKPQPVHKSSSKRIWWLTALASVMPAASDTSMAPS